MPREKCRCNERPDAVVNLEAGQLNWAWRRDRIINVPGVARHARGGGKRNGKCGFSCKGRRALVDDVR